MSSYQAWAMGKSSPLDFLPDALRARFFHARNVPTGGRCRCPHCRAGFTKLRRNHAFCGTECSGAFWHGAETAKDEAVRAERKRRPACS